MGMVSLPLQSAKLPLLRAGNFFAGAKKSPRNTFSCVEAVFAECPSLAMQRTAHILCALAGDVADMKSVTFANRFSLPTSFARTRESSDFRLLFHL